MSKGIKIISKLMTLFAFVFIAAFGISNNAEASGLNTDFNSSISTKENKAQIQSSIMEENKQLSYTFDNGLLGKFPVVKSVAASKSGYIYINIYDGVRKSDESNRLVRVKYSFNYDAGKISGSKFSVADGDKNYIDLDNTKFVKLIKVNEEGAGYETLKLLLRVKKPKNCYLTNGDSGTNPIYGNFFPSTKSTLDQAISQDKSKLCTNSNSDTFVNIYFYANLFTTGVVKPDGLKATHYTEYMQWEKFKNEVTYKYKTGSKTTEIKSVAKVCGATQSFPVSNIPNYGTKYYVKSYSTSDSGVDKNNVNGKMSANTYTFGSDQGTPAGEVHKTTVTAVLAEVEKPGVDVSITSTNKTYDLFGTTWYKDNFTFKAVGVKKSNDLGKVGFNITNSAGVTANPNGTATAEYKGTASGTWIVKNVYAQDKYNNKTTLQDTYTIKLDAAAPSVSATIVNGINVNGKIYSTSNTQVVFKADDKESGYKYSVIKENGDIIKNNQADKEIKVNAFNLSTDTTYEIISYDNVDHTTTKTITVYADNTVPTVNLQPTANNVTDNSIAGVNWFKDNINITATGFDKESGVKEVHLSDSNSSQMQKKTASGYVNSLDFNKSFSYNNTDVNGAIKLTTFAFNNINMKSETKSNLFYIDGLAPIITGGTIEDESNARNIEVSSYEEKGIFSVDIEPAKAGRKPDKDADWKNVNVLLTVSSKDTQVGLLRFVLQKYSEESGSWNDYSVQECSGELDEVTKTFTITESGQYRVAVYDKFEHVSYTTDEDFYIDKETPVISTEKLEYDWINKPVDLHFDIKENDNGSGIKTVTLVQSLEDGTEKEIEYSKNISSDSMSGTADAKITEEGITYYRLYVEDNAGNKGFVFVTVKIDYVAPKPSINVEFEDILNITLSDVVEELSGCDRDRTFVIIKDVDGNVEEQTHYFNLTSEDNIHNGASFESGDIDIYTYYSDCDRLQLEIHMFDIAGNENITDDLTIDIFRVDAKLYRYLSEKDGNTGDITKGEVWRTGESGLVKIDAGSYIDRIEIIYPREWVQNQADDVTYPLNLYLNTFNYDPHELKTVEEDEFMIPLKCKNENSEYVIKVKAYKYRGGVEKVKEKELPLKVTGSVTDDLKTRIRYKND